MVGLEQHDIFQAVAGYQQVAVTRWELMECISDGML
jgi:hypothetical protein